MELLKSLVHTGHVLLGHCPKVLTGAVCLVGALVMAVRRGNRQREKRLILQAQSQREHSFQEAERAVLKYKQSHPNVDSTFILGLSLSELTKQLQEGSLSPEEVFYVYMEKTLELQGKLNCSTGIILDSFEQLKKINSCEKGILYGVPISLKENVSLKKQVCSCGVVNFLNQPAADDSVLVKVLKKQGAIPFVRTNIPQGLLSYECSNPIYGQTLNPHGVQRNCGGSSGGEAALIGGGGSVVGIGSDIGGSLRVPASFCGICTLKPTAGRLSSKGCRPIYRGQKTVLSSLGPMGRDVESLAVLMKAILCEDMFSLDPTVPRLLFNEEVYKSRKPLTIGYYDHIEGIPTTPSMMRAVHEVKALLEQAGHTLVPYKPVRVGKISHLFFRGLLADGGRTFLQQVKGNTIDPAIQKQVSMYRMPIWLKKLLGVVLKPLWPKVAKDLDILTGVGSVAGLWKLQASIEDCVNDTVAEWRRLNIDVVLCPIPGPAFKPCKRVRVLPYAGIYNLLNFCAGVVPVSIVTAQDESDLSCLDKADRFDRILKEAVTGGVGLPVCVQCVALPWQEELCLRFMKEVEQLVKNTANK